MSQGLPDFFVSRAGAHPADVAMAAKVGQIIEAEGHRVVLQQWDFANRNFMERMDADLASGARVVAILTPQYLATDYCAAEWMHALDGDPLNRKGRLIVLRAAECEPKGLLRTIAYWDLASVRDRDDLLTDIVKAAIMPDAERRHVGAADAHWREARTLLHEAIKPTPSFTGRDEHLQKIRDAVVGPEQGCHHYSAGSCHRPRRHRQIDPGARVCVAGPGPLRGGLVAQCGERPQHRE